MTKTTKKATKCIEIPKTKVITKEKKKTTPTPVDNKKTLEVCLLMDCTNSMQEWIERSKETLREIINNVKS